MPTKENGFDPDTAPVASSTGFSAFEIIGHVDEPVRVESMHAGSPDEQRQSITLQESRRSPK